MLGPDRQRDVLGRIAEAASRVGLLVAPIGNVYFFVQQRASFETKDLDAVVHQEDLSVADLDSVVSMAKLLGEHEVQRDRAVVVVYLDGPKDGPDTAVVELIRGKPRAHGGYLPRPLLTKAGHQARRDGAVLWYKPEFVLVMKADAAVDRQERAAKGGPYAEDNRRRAETFRADVFSQMGSRNTWDVEALREAAGLIKKSRQKGVADLIGSASAGRIRL